MLPEANTPESNRSRPELSVTLCPEDAHVHVTTPPKRILTAGGLNTGAPPGPTVTLALGGADGTLAGIEAEAGGKAAVANTRVRMPNGVRRAFFTSTHAPPGPASAMWGEGLANAQGRASEAPRYGVTVRVPRGDQSVCAPLGATSSILARNSHFPRGS